MLAPPQHRATSEPPRPKRICPRPGLQGLGEDQELRHRNKDTDLLENGLEDMGRGKGKLGQSEREAWT